MGSIGRYVFRTTFGAFAMVLVSVTALMWITPALRNIDLITNQGQALFVFIGVTALIIPLLVLLIAPIALCVSLLVAVFSAYVSPKCPRLMRQWSVQVRSDIGMLAGAKSGGALALPDVAQAATVISGYWGISRGLIIEPPASVAKAITAIVEGFQRRAAAFTGAAQ